MSSSRSTPRRSIVVPVPRPEKRAAAQPRRSMSAPDGVGTARRGASPSRGPSTSPVPCFPAIPPSVGRRFGRNPAISSTRSSNVRRTRIERTRPAFPRPSPRAHRPNVFALTSNSRARSEAFAHVRAPLTARASSAPSRRHSGANARNHAITSTWPREGLRRSRSRMRSRAKRPSSPMSIALCSARRSSSQSLPMMPRSVSVAMPKYSANLFVSAMFFFVIGVIRSGCSHAVRPVRAVRASGA